MIRISTLWDRIATCLLLAGSVGMIFGKTAVAAHGVGNPGDPVRLLMSGARSDARIILIRIAPADLLANVTQETRLRYGEMRAAMDLVLREPDAGGAAFVWEEGTPQSPCAFAVPADNTIYFTYNPCRASVSSPAAAILLLLHEATHLVGNQNEQLADDVAQAVYGAWLVSDAQRNPRWDSTNPNGSPVERAGHASVAFRGLDGHEKIFVWGGCNDSAGVGIDCSSFQSDGALYDATTQDGQWTAIGAPQIAGVDPLELSRTYSTAVHYRSDETREGKVIIFGGCSGADHVCRITYSSLLIYDLDTASWSFLPAPGSASTPWPVGRFKHSAFWTGREMLIWSGITDLATVTQGRSLGDAWLFDPEAGTWRQVGATGGPEPRRFSSAVLTGDANNPDDRTLIVFGGCDRQVGEYCPITYQNGAILSLATPAGSWRLINAQPFGVKSRAQHTAVWTGDRMVIHGGRSRSAGGVTTLQDAAEYFPATENTPDRWVILSSVSSTGRFDHMAHWAGDRMLVWGGKATLDRFVPGVQEFYLPDALHAFGNWATPVVTGAPVPRVGGSAHWLTTGLFVWGGKSEDLGSYLNSGGLFRPNFSPR